MPTETNFAPNLGEIFEAHSGPVEVFDFNGVPSGAAPEKSFGIDTTNGDFYQVVNGSWVFKFSTGGGVGAVQTPWAQDIQGAGFDLLNVRDITATRHIRADTIGVIDQEQLGDTASEWYFQSELAGLSLYSNGSGGVEKWLTISDPEEGMTLYGTYTFHANGFQGKEFFSLDALNAIPLQVSGFSLTGANDWSALTISGTWNTTGVPTAIKLNMLDTASDAASLLMDLQTGSASKFKVGKLGSVTMGNLLTITQATVNTSILASTGYSLTGSNATSMIDLAGTWNTSGNPVALKLAISNTASGATSKFLSFLAGAAGATEVFSVSKGGLTTAALQFDVASNASLGAFGLTIRNDGGIFWSSTSSYTGGVDLQLLRDAANTLALRNSTNAQALHLYQTYTDASNYSRLRITHETSAFRIYSQHAGTGTAQPLIFGTGGGERWELSTSGHWLAKTDNTYDIGASGATRPRALYVATTGTFGGGVSGASFAASDFIGLGRLLFTGQGTFRTNSDGVYSIANAANTDFGRLQFGGTTSSFGGVARDGAGLRIVTADSNTAYSFLGVSELRDSGGLKVVGARAAAVADASDNPTAITQLNDLLAKLRTHGLIAA